MAKTFFSKCNNEDFNFNHKISHKILQFSTFNRFLNWFQIPILVANSAYVTKKKFEIYFQKKRKLGNEEPNFKGGFANF